MTVAPRKSESISNIQALRGWAALGVVYYHTAYVAPGIGHTDFLGVTIFFAISGFIMTHITRESADGFIRARLIRIVPLYWIATLFSFVWIGFGFANPFYVIPAWAGLWNASPVYLVGWFSNQFHALFGPETVSKLITSALFIPTSEPPALGVGWTLNIEMFFYVLFWLALFISRRFAPLIVSGILLAFKLPPLIDLVPLYGHVYTSSFIAGIAVYYVWRAFVFGADRLSPSLIKPLTLAFSAISIAAYLLVSTYRSDMIPMGLMQWVYRPEMTMPAVLVLSALMLHSVGVRITARWVLLLGDASYALYLFHGDVVETLRSMAPTLPGLDFRENAGAVLLALVLSCLFAVAVHWWVEKPLLRAMRGSGGRKPVTAPPVPMEPAPAE